MSESMRATARDVVRAAGLWRIWARLGVQDVRLKFRRSALGVSWIFVNLTVMVLAIGFIYANLLGQPTPGVHPVSHDRVDSVELPHRVRSWRAATRSSTPRATSSRSACRSTSMSFAPSFPSGSPRSFTLSAFVLVALLYRVPAGPGTLLAVPGFMLMMIASLLLDHDFRAPEHALPRRRAPGVGRHAGAVLRDAGHLSGRAAAQRPPVVARD